MKFDPCIKISFLFQVIITFFLVGTLIFPWLQISIDTLPTLITVKSTNKKNCEQ